MSLSERDKKLIWHPLTQEKTSGLPISIAKAKGSYIYDETGKAYLDLISSWWVNLHGHSHPLIARSIYKQALTLEHVIFAGFTHKPAVQLCELLKTILPQKLSKFFFSDNGSSSVEIALKIAYQFWHNQNQKNKTLFLSFEGGYHGDTFGAMSVSATPAYHNVFNNFFFKVLNIPFPLTWYNDNDISNKEGIALKALDKHLSENANNIAALILEPLVQGSSGMRMCRPQFIDEVIKRVRKFDILVIFDEIMTGFGRIGSNFAIDQIKEVPDIICLSKGITGGFLPLALTITTDTIYEAFLSDDLSKAFSHSHSYTANPLACSAAIASIKLLLKNSTQESITNINQSHKAFADNLIENYLNIKNIRVSGTILAFEFIGNQPINLNQRLKSEFLNAGLLIRPIGHTIYLMPPYSVTTQELEFAYHKILDILREL